MNGLIQWPPCSPDIVLFFWDYIKNRAFATLVAGVEEPNVRIKDDVCIFADGIFKYTGRKFKYRLCILRAINFIRILKMYP